MQNRSVTGVGADRSSARFWPGDALGWWAFALLLAAATSPATIWGLWVLVRFDDPEATWRAFATVAVAVPAVVLGAAALARPASNAITLVALAVVVGIELVWAILWVVAFGNGALGLTIGIGAAACIGVGVVIGMRHAHR